MDKFEQWYVDTYYKPHGVVPPTNLFKRYEGTYLIDDVYRQNLAWQHQQAKVEELEGKLKQAYEDVDTFAEAHERECGFKAQLAKDKAELQKRVDAALQLIPSIKAENDLWGCDQVERQIELLEQALKGEG